LGVKLNRAVVTETFAGLSVVRINGDHPAIIDWQVEENLSYWMSVHPDSRNLPNVRAVMDFLIEIVRDKQDLF
jgi:hypothetical protein